ncbi:MAG TPA: ankyrin repeat domain-containing protein [Patescibacteria group bacterium]|nr:ankyrin repeat domain-containing protein [Patescibacteria group bacterium]
MAMKPPHAPLPPGGAEDFFDAAARGDVDVVRKFLKQYPRLRDDNSSPTAATAIILAAKEGRLEVVKLLAEAGANLRAGDRGDQSALFYAAYKGEAAVARFLISLGVDPRAPNRSGQSPAMMARAADLPMFADEMEKQYDQYLADKLEAERRARAEKEELHRQNVQDVTTAVKDGVKTQVAAPTTASFRKGRAP